MCCRDPSFYEMFYEHTELSFHSQLLNLLFQSKQIKEIEGNNRMGKTRHLFKKIRDTKGVFHTKFVNKGEKWYGPNKSRRC